MPSYVNFMGVLVIAFVSPLIAAVIPKVRVPTIVLEFVLGVIVGPDVLGWIKVDNPLDVLSVLALSFLLFTAGTEVELSSLRGALLGKAAASYVVYPPKAARSATWLWPIGRRANRPSSSQTSSPDATPWCSQSSRPVETSTIQPS